MERFSVFVTRKLPDAGIEILRRAGFDIEIFEGDQGPSREELKERMRGKNALLCLLTDSIDTEIFDAAQDLGIVANYAVGFNNIDVAAATSHGVLVTNTPGVLTETVAEHTMALLLAAARRIVEADAFTREGRFKGWDPMLFLGRDLRGKTLGVIGLGRIGSAVAGIALQGFGMKIVYTKRSRNETFEQEYGAVFADLETLLRRADFISIHVPFTPQTRHLIGFREFDLMKETAVLVNTARGPIVDERALIDALKNNRIAAAALDVFECEPAIACDPAASARLKDLPNVVLTPHIASASIETRTRMAELAAGSIVDFAKGKRPEHCVNPEVLEREGA